MPLYEYDNEEDLERADLYKLLAALFLDIPAEEVLEELKDIDDFKVNESLDEIGQDFHDLFVHNTVPLYESFYNYPVGEQPGPWGKATEEVQRFYKTLGLTIDEELQIVPDHMSAELFFMSYLVENGFLPGQKKFLEEHLVKWIPLFCDGIQAHAKTDFYRRIAILLKELVSSDSEELRGV